MTYQLNIAESKLTQIHETAADLLNEPQSVVSMQEKLELILDCCKVAQDRIYISMIVKVMAYIL